MGKKSTGLRRNSEHGTVMVTPGSRHYDWKVKVNPPAMTGWSSSMEPIEKANYAASRWQQKTRMGLTKERLASKQVVSNGVGVTGSARNGYVVYGSYREKEAVPTRKPAVERLAIQLEKQRGTSVRIERLSRKQRIQEQCQDPSVKKEYTKFKTQVSKMRLRCRSRRLSMDRRADGVFRSGRRPASERVCNRTRIQLEDTVYHKKVLRTMKRLMDVFSKTNQFGRKMPNKVSPGGYFGYKRKVNGTIGGALRSGSYVDQLGRMPLTTKAAKIDSTMEIAKTSVGTLGIHVHYCYAA